MRLPPRRNEWFRDIDGVWTRQKMYDEILSDEIIFPADTLNSATISSHSWPEQSGVTISSDAVNSDADGVSFTVTGAGYATLRVVLSDGVQLEERLRWVAPDATSLSDYGG